MEKRATNISGILLITLGGMALLHTTILPMFGWEFGLWRLWPMLVGAVGLALVSMPILMPQPGFKPLFIPGVTVLVTGSLLLWSSLFNWWGVWATFWPLLIIGLAIGFAMTAVSMRIIWFMIPATIIGLNGLIFQFCTLTGWWHSWSILWTLEPLIVGMGLLIASSGHRRGLINVGLILATISLATFSLMSFLLSGWVSFVGAFALIAGGLILLVRGRTAPDLILVDEKSPKEKLYDSL